MTPTQKTKAKKEAGRLIVEGIQDSLDQSVSPVAGGRFKKSKADGDRSILFEEGDLRDAITHKDAGGSFIEVGVYESDELEKAYNHNMGANNASNSTVPERRFIPDKDQNFKKKVTNRVDRRLNEIRKGQSETRVKELQTTTLDRLFEEATDEATGTDTSSSANIAFTIGQLLDLFDE
jgi:hypothetical protein